MRWIAGLLSLLAVACAPLTQEAPRSGPAMAEKPVPAATEEACAAQGGDWAPVCRLQKPQCVLTFSDAGKACTDSAQCQGRCETDFSKGQIPAGEPAAGRCSMNSNPCGCSQRVEGGVATPALCVD